MGLVVIGLVLPWIILAVMAWVAYAYGLQLVGQNARFERQVSSFIIKVGELQQATSESEAAGMSESDGLTVGAAPSDFSLPDLNDNMSLVSLAQFRGKKVLLMFYRPGCVYCQAMAPQLAELPFDGSDGHPIPLVIAEGDEQENRDFIQKYNLRGPFLLQHETDLYPEYEVLGTPMGYLIDENGIVASARAAGADGLLQLFRDPDSAIESSRLGSDGGATDEQGNPKIINKSLVPNSRIVRDGLKAGTPAPAFRLPLLSGGELALTDYAGKRVLLVFSDAHCGPCQLLAPDLERVHRTNSHIQVLMISRGTPEENRAKVAEHSLTFPVVLQRQWEISRAYGMFATPIGYLIDEEGVLASDVAVGGDAILALASGAKAKGTAMEVMSINP